MSARNPIAHVEYFHPADPAGWLKPDEPFIVDGIDWSWAFVVYRPIVDFPGYCVGSNGMAWTCRKRTSLGYARGSFASLGDDWKRLKPLLLPTGHTKVNLYRDGKRYQFLIHRVELEAFIGPSPNGTNACHYDDNPCNNRISNLRWDTQKANLSDAIRNNRIEIGEDHHEAKLTEDQVVEIRKKYATGLMFQWQIALQYGVESSDINMIVNGKIWKHVGGPLTFRGRELRIGRDKAEEIRELVAGGMTQKEVARRLGLGTSSISRVVNRCSAVDKHQC